MGAVLAAVLVTVTIASVVAGNRMAASAADERRLAQAVDAQKASSQRAKAELAKKTAESSFAAAREAERMARAAEEEGRKLLYTTDMQLAPFLWSDDRTTAEQLRILLAKHIPDHRTERGCMPRREARSAWL